jgi:hypothetical protein
MAPMYITLQQASEHLAAKGLTGQSVNVLRSAIAGGRLAGVKDGRCWKTTVEKLDAYELTLWKNAASKRQQPDTPMVVRHPDGSASCISTIAALASAERMRATLRAKARAAREADVGASDKGG